jgi:hypothetical protein
MNALTIHQLAKGFRRKRMQLFLKKFTLTPETTILDVGGFHNFWKESGITAKVTILRLEGPEKLPPDCPPNFTSIQGNGCDLKEHADKSFDIVFSNSVIEHVGDFEPQMRFAKETARVGKSYWVQTPAVEFPIEPHLLVPFYHFMPRALQERCFRFTTWGLLRPDRATLQEYHDHARAYLLSRRKLKIMFPDAEIMTERVLGWPKSYTVVRQE